MPPFDRALVDGYAVKAADTFAAGEDEPIELELAAETAPAGAVPKTEVRAGTAVVTGPVDAQGNYEVKGVPAGTYLVMLSKASKGGDFHGQETLEVPHPVEGRQAIGEPDPHGLLAADPATCVEQFERSLLAHQPGQCHGQPEAVMEPEPGEVGTEPCLGRRYPEVGHARQAQAAADRSTLHRRDDRRAGGEQIDRGVVQMAR